MRDIDCDIVPVFNLDKKICQDFERVELLCDDYLGNVYSNEYRQKCWAHHLENTQEENAFAFAAYYKKQMIGFSDGYAEGDVMNLDSLFVEPIYQDVGVGAKLLKASEQAAGIIKSDMRLLPLINAIGFYQKYKYSYGSDGIHLMKHLPKPVAGVVPVFQWCDELSAKLNVKIDNALLDVCKGKPMFVYVNANGNIDGVALRLSNDKNMLKLNDRQPKHRGSELLWYLDNCR